jgi:xylulokinase
MSDPVAVGVDVGSSSARAVALDRSGSVVSYAVSRYSMENASAGEVDPAVWVQGATDAIHGLDVEPSAVCFGGIGPTSVASGGEAALTFRHPAGAAAGPADQQAAQAAVLREEFGPDTQPRLLWDWVAAQFGARSDSQALWPGSVPYEGFGEPVPAGNPIGVTSGAHGIASGITLAAGANDAYFTSWGSGIDVPGKAFDPGGTTGGLGVAVRASEHPDAARFGMASHVPDISIVGGPVASHGAALDWWSNLTGRAIPELLDLAATVPPGSHGVMVLPFFEGERAPRWNLGLKAAMSGLTLEADVAVITRAILESTAYGLAHIARSLADQGIVLERVVSSGGPSQSRLWCEIKAAVLEVPIDVPEFHQMSSFGAALGAGAALGWWPRPGEGVAGDWPLPAVSTVTAEPEDVYRAGLQEFIESGDAAVAALGS